MITSIGKGVGWATGMPAPEIPRNVQLKGFQRT
jgi:hypothetical protein